MKLLLWFYVTGSRVPQKFSFLKMKAFYLGIF